MALRADMAERGWSVQNDVPGRLAWVDFWSLFVSFLSDPGTRTFAGVVGMEYPADRLTLLVSGALGVPTPFRDRTAAASRAEVLRAAKNMSSRFRHLYEG